MRQTAPATALATMILTGGLVAPAAGQGPQFLPAQHVGTVQHASIDEASGLAASRANPGVLWVHNDSGDTARVFAMNVQGTHLGIYNLSGASATDWEDTAVGPGPVEGQSYLYLGDIGDNNAVRSTIRVYRAPEPAVSPSQPPVNVDLSDVATTTLQYPDGPRDAETLMIDQATADLYIVSKRETPSRLYRAAFPQSTSETICFHGTGRGYYTVSEGSSQPIYYYERVPEPGDLDSDGDVDVGDSVVLADCLSGPAAVPALGCEDADLTTDSDVDVADLAKFQQLLIGP